MAIMRAGRGEMMHDITGGKPDQSLAGLGQFHKLEKQERRFDLIVLMSMVPPAGL